MIDKTAIEKAKEALQRAGVLLAGQMYHTDYIEEALAAIEAEKPAEDLKTNDYIPRDLYHAAKEITGLLGKISLSILRSRGLRIKTDVEAGNFVGEEMDKSLPVIQCFFEKFAVAYHAERCRACSKAHRNSGGESLFSVD